MRAFHTASLLTAALMLAAPLHAARAQDDRPAALLGAWGQDSSCTEDVAVFRPDGTVIDIGAQPGGAPATYSVADGTLTLTQGSAAAHFAFALNGTSVAWSNGANMVLKERCADQSAFAAQLGRPVQTGSLYDRILALAGQTIGYGATQIKVLSVDGHLAQKGAGYDEVVAHPDPALVGKHAVLIYRIFPHVQTAASHASLDVQAPGNFLAEPRGAGTMSVATAKDLGPDGNAPAAAQGTINCLRFHPKGQEEVVITCLEQMPNTRLVAVGRQSFTLPPNATDQDLGTKAALTETLQLTSLAIDQLRDFLVANPGL